MMVLIMTNINYLVILICSTLFFLSSFVLSQQKRTYTDPLKFYERAVYLHDHRPDAYAKNYRKIYENYNKLINVAEKKRNPSNRGIPNNNGQFERNNEFLYARAKDVKQVPPQPYRKPLVNNYNSSKTELLPKSLKYSRSLNNPVTPNVETTLKSRRELEDKETTGILSDQDWNHYCYYLGYNNTNNVCQSNQTEKINSAPNVTRCHTYFNLGCRHKSNEIFCKGAIIEVMKNINFDCNGINIDGDSDWTSFQCCMACKGGLNAATSKDSCDMHVDSTLPSLAQESCCKSALSSNSNASVTTTTELTLTTLKPGSMDAIFAYLDERFSNSTALELKTDSSTIPVFSPQPTTTAITTTTLIVTTPTTTEPSTITTEPSTTTTEPTTTTTTIAPTAATTATTTTTTTTSPTTTTLPSPSTPILSALVDTTDETRLSSFEARKVSSEMRIPEGYKLHKKENNIYRKVDVEDRSKPDYLIILERELAIENDGHYQNFKLMNLTLKSNIQCDWEFNLENVDAADDVEPLNEINFIEKPQNQSFILLLDGNVKPQSIQYSVACNIKKYKYYKYKIYLTFK